MRVEIEATNAATGKTASVLCVFNERELMVMLFEAITRQQRPEGMPWEQAADEIEHHFPTEAEDFRHAARAAMGYFAQQVNLAGRTPDDKVQ